MNTTTFDLPRRHALQRRDTLDWVFAALVLRGVREARGGVLVRRAEV